MLTDTHAHLDFPDFAGDVPGVLARAEAAGVHRFVTIGTTLQGCERALALAEAHPQVWAAVGLHPIHAHEAEPDFAERLRALASHARVVALGEAGLDHHWLPSAVRARGGEPEPTPFSESELQAQQERVFRAQLDLAVETGLSVIVHQRAAWAETVSILREYTGRVRAVFHCFGESWQRAREIFALGHLISFTGIVTFKNAAQIQDVARRVAHDQFMVETDSPYLAPVPHRGRRCEPAFVRETAEFIAQLRGVSVETLAAHTEPVANAFFRFRSEHPVRS